MTGFASGTGRHQSVEWTWDIRSVNGKGLEVKLRLPDLLADMEKDVRSLIGAVAKRGNIYLNLRMNVSHDAGLPEIDMGQLDALVQRVQDISYFAAAKGVTLAPLTAVDLMRQLPNKSGDRMSEEETALLAAAVFADLKTGVAAFADARASEGTALEEILCGQIDEIASHVDAAIALLDDRKAQMKNQLETQVSRILDTAKSEDPTRLAQELALIYVKTDVAEELDRLRAHVDAARELIAANGPVGRKLDFLCQEFNREANTLCSKAQYQPLTAIGLELKTVIDQMREQIQNVE
jgi:uncharacterized protein (TIGR00255 family)